MKNKHININVDMEVSLVVLFILWLIQTYYAYTCVYVCTDVCIC